MKQVYSLLLLLLILFIAGAGYYSFYRNPFEIGKCYKWVNPDPFKERDSVIKVVQVQGSYIQYIYIWENGVVSTPSSSNVILMRGYKECDCKN